MNRYEITVGIDTAEEVGETFLLAVEAGEPIRIVYDDSVVVYQPKES